MMKLILENEIKIAKLCTFIKTLFKIKNTTYLLFYIIYI
jgi:hypothetical protein